MKIECGSNRPAAVTLACGNWFDGASSAMYAVWLGKPFNPTTLLKEIDACKPFNAKQRSDLDQLRAWATAQKKAADARCMLVRAARLKRVAIDAALKVGLERWEAEQVFDLAFSVRLAKTQAEATSHG